MPIMKSLVRPQRVCFVDAEKVRKEGDVFRLKREIEAMAYVQNNTSIPIPTVLEQHLEDRDDAQGWFLMTRLPGQQLGDCWPIMGESAKAETIRNLRMYLDQLHHLHPSPPGWIGSCSKGPAYDHRIDNSTTFGPFATVSEFHDFLIAPVRASPRPEWVDKYRRRLSDSHDIIFCHADLRGSNILVEPFTGQITGILDWEMAGFWPAWWEYRKSIWSGGWWADVASQMMECYPGEADADNDLQAF